MWAAVVARARVRVRTSLFSPLLHGTPVYRPLVRRRSSLVSLCAGGRRPDDGEIPSLLAVAVALSYVRTSTSARHIAWQGAPAAGFQLANVALDPSQESEVITVLNKCSNTTVHQREPAPTSGSQPNEYIAFSSCGLLASYFSLRTHQHKQPATSQTN